MFFLQTRVTAECLLTSSMSTTGNLLITKAIEKRFLMHRCKPLYNQFHLVTASNLKQLLTNQQGNILFPP